MSLKSGTLSVIFPIEGIILTILHLLDLFPSSAAFDAINSSLQADDAERKDAVKKGNAVFAFILKNKEGQTDSWYIDLKEKGEVAKGEAPSGKKADGQCALISKLEAKGGCPVLEAPQVATQNCKETKIEDTC